MEDVMAILNVGQSLAYRLIRDCNNELAEAGYFTVAGRVPIAKFREKIYCGRGGADIATSTRPKKSAVR